MSPLINFENYKISKENKFKGRKPNDTSDTQGTIFNEFDANESFKLNLEILTKNNPDKILFSLKEVSELLMVGDEFIRRRIKSGKIRATYLGDKPSISLTELARIITEGV